MHAAQLHHDFWTLEEVVIRHCRLTVWQAGGSMGLQLFRIHFPLVTEIMAGFDSRRASREVTPGYLGGSQGLILKLNTLLAVCVVGIDESSTVKVRL
jgi:hypothetical protein